jgi:hypothetical protein
MPHRITADFIVLLVTLAASAGAQPIGFGGPLSGVVYESASRSLRPLLGVPGSAFRGAPVLDDVDSASIAPGGKWALITRAGRSRLLGSLTDRDGSILFPEDLTDGVDRVAWSSDGSVALLYASSGGKFVRARWSRNKLVTDIPFTPPPAGSVVAAVMDSAGRRAAVGVAGADAGGLYLLEEGRAPLLLSPIARPIAAAFDETGDRLFAVDPVAQRIVEFDGAGGPIEFAPLRPQDGQAVDPAGLAVAGGGRYLVLADRSNRAVRVYETSSRSFIDTIPLEFAPTRLDRLCDGSVFLLNGDVGREWLMLLDARRNPAVFFVPAAEEELR